MRLTNATRCSLSAKSVLRARLGSIAMASPNLRAAQQRHANIAAHHKPLPPGLDTHLAAVLVAVHRIEDPATVPSVALFPHTPDNGHAQDLLVLAFVRTLRAAALGRVVCI